MVVKVFAIPVKKRPEKITVSELGSTEEKI